MTDRTEYTEARTVTRQAIAMGARVEDAVAEILDGAYVEGSRTRLIDVMVTVRFERESGE